VPPKTRCWSNLAIAGSVFKPIPQSGNPSPARYSSFARRLAGAEPFHEFGKFIGFFGHSSQIDLKLCKFHAESWFR
jgi:hypothetical protein